MSASPVVAQAEAESDLGGLSPDDPYFYGYRYVEVVQADGSTKVVKQPLTEYDVLHPQEDDSIMTNDAHDVNLTYLKEVLSGVMTSREDVLVLREHRIDWQHPEIAPHGPDLSVFEGLSSPWDKSTATFYVSDAGARPLLIVEATSPSTRRLDFDERTDEYFAVGVPFYLIVDRRGPLGKGRLEFIGYRSTPEGFVPVSVDAEKGVWVPAVQLWFRGEGEYVACFTASGERKLAGREYAVAEAERAEREKAKAVEAVAWAEREKAKAVEAVARANSEKARVDAIAQDAAATIAELRRQIEALQGQGKS